MEGVFKFINKNTVISIATLILAFSLDASAFAGAPFLTDDPVPVDYQHYEIYLSAAIDKNNTRVEEPQLEFPEFEVDWGPIPNLQLHLNIPYAWSLPTAAPAAHGIGDVETGAKYRFIQETSSIPQVAVYPLLELPTGNAERNLGNGKLWMKIPIWLQKSWGPWTTYGGGGYAINPAKDARNYPFAGWLIQKDLNERLTLGVEAFSQGASSTLSRSYTIINLGGNYNFTKQFSLLFSAGHSVLGEQQLVGYIGLYWTGSASNSIAR